MYRHAGVLSSTVVLKITLLLLGTSGLGEPRELTLWNCVVPLSEWELVARDHYFSGRGSLELHNLA